MKCEHTMSILCVQTLIFAPFFFQENEEEKKQKAAETEDKQKQEAEEESLSQSGLSKGEY